MDIYLKQQLEKLEESFEQCAPFLKNMVKHTTRLFSAVRDGYHEAALTNAGSIIEDMLRDVWKREKIPGQETKKTIEQLFSVIKKQLDIDRLVEDYIRDIRQARNRAAHGKGLMAEDSLENIRKLSVVLNWYADTYLSDKERYGTSNRVLHTKPSSSLHIGPHVADYGESKSSDSTEDKAHKVISLPSSADIGKADRDKAKVSARQEKTLEIEISRDADTIKTVIQKKGVGEEEETMRHYEEKKIDTLRIETKCREIVRTLNNANLRGSLAGENLIQLKNNGFALFEELLPHDTQKELSSTTFDNLIINIDDGLVHIPWELLYDGHDFLCRKFNVGRVVRTRQKITKPRSKKLPTPARVLVLCDPKGDLKDAYREGDRILAELDKAATEVHADLFNRSIDEDMLREEIRNYDIIHYAGHADYNAEDPSDSGWLLDDGKFTSRDILQMSQNLPLPTLIFSNACQSGQTTEWNLDEHFENKIFGLAHAFLVSGVQHYIGTFWEVLDEVSCEFSVCFYQNLIRGESIGCAVKKAREHLINQYGEDNIIWASYVLYGHPGYKYFESAEKVTGADNVSGYQPLDSAEAMTAGPTRARPSERNKSTVSIAAGLVIAVTLLAAYLIVKDKIIVTTNTPGEKTSAAVASVEDAKKDILTVMKALSQKYKEQKKLMSTKKPPDPWTSRPLTLSIFGFSCIGNVRDREQTKQYLISNLSREIHNTGRIKLLEREKLDAILQELKISTSDIADQDTAMVMLGRLLGARLISSGKIVEMKGETTVNLRVFETDSSRIVISLHETLSRDKTENVAKRLAGSIAKQIETLYPLKGKIAMVKEKEVLLNIGSDTGVLPRARFTVLTGKEILGTDGRFLGYDEKEIGMIKITKVRKKISNAEIRRHKDPLKKGMRVRETK